MAEVMEAPGMPKKVFWKALELGAHEACLDNGDPCASCEAVVHSAFEYFYGSSPSTEALIASILNDFRLDILEDL